MTTDQPTPAPADPPAAPHTEPLPEPHTAHIEPQPDPRPEPPADLRPPSGVHWPAVVLGLVCVAIAVLVMAQELGGLTVDWGSSGPLGVVAIGAVLVAVGLMGLLGRRRRS